MNIITTTDDLSALCARLAGAPFITVDTEFMRESTYWPKLCLVQIAGPDEAAAIDPLAPGLSLEPLLAMMRNRDQLKVFHAARQDLEIFYHLMGEVPAPIFDTQVAAMVCGFGEQVGYETLVNTLAGATIDKTSRFTDWSKRPLTERQVTYALSDVTHLRTIYKKLVARIAKSQRDSWLGEEMAILAEPKTYLVEPQEAWMRLKTRSTNPKFLAALRAVTAWREIEARARDIPRSRILRDEALLEIAGDPPSTVEGLLRVRGMSRGLAEGSAGANLLQALTAAFAAGPASWPQVEKTEPLPKGIGPLIELLKVLLKLKCDEHDVAQKLVASTADLEAIAVSDDANVAALHGWRRELFGEDALALKHGKLALAAQGKRIRLIRLDSAA
ncbi:MAG: ribonuclease D [Alphaproteobacteria bacterium]|jgi:ribonuclease D|nr:ribonuclease D [Alphaproteobacteria bacterium]